MPSNTIRRKTSKDVAITFQPVIHPRSVYTAACVYPVLGTAQDHIVNVTVPACELKLILRLAVGSYFANVLKKERKVFSHSLYCRSYELSIHPVFQYRRILPSAVWVRAFLGVH